jgi:hypothetical protein
MQTSFTRGFGGFCRRNINARAASEQLLRSRPEQQVNRSTAAGPVSRALEKLLVLVLVPSASSSGKSSAGSTGSTCGTSTGPTGTKVVSTMTMYWPAASWLLMRVLTAESADSAHSTGTRPSTS